MKEIKNRTVIVTGAARGIGYAIAKKFVEHGDFVAIADINGIAAKQAAESIGRNAAGYGVDVTNEESVTKFLNDLENERGDIHVLINNAGMQHIDKIEDFPLDKWKLLIDVMLTGPFLMTKHSLPYMKKMKYGRIINISSVHGIMATPNKSAYVSAKHGLLGLTRTTALETAEDGITANAILPGPVKTTLLMEQIERLKAEEGMTEKQALQKILWPKQPMSRFIEPDEIAGAALYLASHSASSITGESINVSGGI